MRSFFYIIVLFMLLVYLEGSLMSGPAAAFATDLPGTVTHTTKELEVIYLLNQARSNGKQFFDGPLSTYVAQHREEFRLVNGTNDYLESLKKEMYTLESLPVLKPDRLLKQAALYHAEDMGSQGMTSHTSSDGTGAIERIRGYVGEGRYLVGENCFYGKMSALGIVVHLLIDEDVPSLGHRKAILNPDFRRVGVAIAPHIDYGENCVMDFSSEEEAL